jgi:hypothetical protein
MGEYHKSLHTIYNSTYRHKVMVIGKKISRMKLAGNNEIAILCHIFPLQCAFLITLRIHKRTSNYVCNVIGYVCFLCTELLLCFLYTECIK